MNEEATGSAIRTALLDWLPGRATRLQARVVIFYSGHGRFYRSMPFFVPSDGEVGK